MVFFSCMLFWISVLQTSAWPKCCWLSVLYLVYQTFHLDPRGEYGDRPAPHPCHHVSAATQQRFCHCNRLKFPFTCFTRGHVGIACRNRGRVLICHLTSMISNITVSHCFLNPNVSLFMHIRNQSFASVQTPSDWSGISIFTHVPSSSKFATQPSTTCAACGARN